HLARAAVRRAFLRDTRHRGRAGGPLRGPGRGVEPAALELGQLLRGVARRDRLVVLRRPDHRQDARLRGAGLADLAADRLSGRDLGLGRVRTFVHVTLPLSRQAILTGMLITVLPMLGDYFTNQLLSGTSGTTMFGNVINDQLSSSGGVLQGEGAVFSMLFLLM